jgi:TatA/E family protein of Tat protein translocase
LRAAELSSGAYKEASIMLGSTEILVIGVVVLVLFGARAIPKFARSLGQARKEFEAGAGGENDDGGGGAPDRGDDGSGERDSSTGGDDSRRGNR